MKKCSSGHTDNHSRFSGAPMKRSVVAPRLLAATILIASLSGCATAQPGAAPAATPQAQASTPEKVPDPAEAACDSLSEPASLSYNAWNDYHKGTIDLQTSIEQLEQASILFSTIDAPTGSIEMAVSNILTYIDAGAPGPEGQPYDTGTDEFFNLTAALASACSAAGQELIVKAHGG